MNLVSRLVPGCSLSEGEREQGELIIVFITTTTGFLSIGVMKRALYPCHGDHCATMHDRFVGVRQVIIGPWRQGPMMSPCVEAAAQ